MKILGYNVQFLKANQKQTNTGNPKSKDVRTYPALRNKPIRKIDISTLQFGIDKANDINNANRFYLYDLYRIITYFDSHLKGVMMKRKLAITNKRLYAYNIDGTINEDISKKLHTAKFNKLLMFLMEAIDYGFSAGQFTDFDNFQFDEVIRENLDPVTMQYKVRDTDTEGKPLVEFENSFFFGSRTDLGLLLQASTLSIHKINVVADWAGLIEKYTYPIQKINYTGNDPDVKKTLADNLLNQGSDASVDLPEGVNIEYVFPNPSGDLQKTFVDTVNEQISILYLGQTMTTANGSSQSQAKVHREVEQMIFQSDKNMLEDWLNSDFRMYWDKMGLDGIDHLAFEPESETGLGEMIDNDLKIKQLIPSLQDDYFKNKYNIETTNTTAV